MVALVGGGVLLLGSDARAFYVPASWAVSGFVLIVWNAWVLMSEVGNSPHCQNAHLVLYTHCSVFGRPVSQVSK